MITDYPSVTQTISTVKHVLLFVPAGPVAVLADLGAVPLPVGPRHLPDKVREEEAVSGRAGGCGNGKEGKGKSRNLYIKTSFDRLY